MHRVLVTFALTFVLASLSVLCALCVPGYGESGVWADATPSDAVPVAAFALVEENSIDEDGDEACAGAQAQVLTRAPVVFLARTDTTTASTGRRIPLPIRQRGPPLAHA